MTHLKRQQLLC